MTTKRKQSGKPSQPGRREFLKYTAAAGAVMGVGSVLGASVVSAAPGGEKGPPADVPGAEPDKKAQYRFKVDITGCPVASANVESVSIDDLSVDVREMTTGADWDYRVYGPGDAHYGSITIRARVGKNSKELYQWWLDTSKGKNIRKNISVIITKRDGSPERRYNVLECFPTRWDSGDYSPSSNVACETIVCKMGRVELA